MIQGIIPVHTQSRGGQSHSPANGRSPVRDFASPGLWMYTGIWFQSQDYVIKVINFISRIHV